MILEKLLDLPVLPLAASGKADITSRASVLSLNDAMLVMVKSGLQWPMDKGKLLKRYSPTQVFSLGNPNMWKAHAKGGSETRDNRMGESAQTYQQGPRVPNLGNLVLPEER